MEKYSLLEELEISYKKYKSSIYFDKTCTLDKDKVVDFEAKGIDKALGTINKLLLENEDEWDKYIENIINKIGVYSFPKKIKVSSESRSNIISNKLSKDTNIKIVNGEKNIQYFIDLPIEGHILGVLWILRLGKNIDNDFYEHSYGNRIIDSEKEEITYSPYLFKPYFNEYESWRDRGLKFAEECYENKKDSIVLMLDITRFYYSVHFTDEIFEHLYKKNMSGSSEDATNLSKNIVNTRLNDFIFSVIKKYSEIMNIVLKKDNNILPIGFLPSAILANWYLDQFDKNMIDRVNPTYYGRYVDDIIIVDKVEKNSKLYFILNKEPFDLHELIETYLIECKPSVICKDDELKCESSVLEETNINECTYNIKFTDELHDTQKGNLELGEDKIKLLYLKKEGTKTLLDKFKSDIRSNSSEFRLLPEDKELFLNSYSDIYKLNKSDSVNKLRGIEKAEINKYELSKFIGKQLTIGNLVDDSSESIFYDDLAKIYDVDVVIKNYTTWEATLSLCVINYKLDKFKELFKIIQSSIDKIDTSSIDETSKKIKSIKETLNKYLKVCVTRSLALIWSKNVKKLIKEIYEEERVHVNIIEKRKQYCLTRMCNKMLMPVLIDALEINISKLNDDKSETKRLNSFHDCLKIWDSTKKKETNGKVTKTDYENQEEVLELMQRLSTYKYHPYVITYQDLTRLHVLCSIKNGKIVKDHILEDIEIDKKEEQEYIKKDEKNKKEDKNGFKSFKNEIEKMYLEINYKKCGKFKNSYKTYNKIIPNNKKIIANVINVSNEEINELKIAIATANLSKKNFLGVLTDSPVRTIERYNKIAEIINQAVKCHANLLVLPESYVPYEWITLLEREAKKNNLAIITGVEHIKYDKRIYNLTATILPYKVEKYKYVHTNFRTKVTYSPEELRQINGYRLEAVEGNEYNLFVWNNVWIPVYCCFEIASIIDRSIFYSLTDLFVIVEWNHDINYFSNIIESLSRDIHCYCVQVNSAEYGDSCIVKPSKTANKSIVRTKGGINNSILVAKVDIGALRDFQIKEYELQKDDKRFKSTPPLFDKDSVELRRKNKLFIKLGEKKFGYKFFKEGESEK